MNPGITPPVSHGGPKSSRVSLVWLVLKEGGRLRSALYPTPDRDCEMNSEFDRQRSHHDTTSLLRGR